MRDTPCTLIRFGDYLLETAYRPEFQTGSSVRWVLPDSGIRFRAISKHEPVLQQNRVEGQVVKFLALGNEVRLTLAIATNAAPLRVTIPRRLADELQLQEGVTVAISLRAEDIHLFPHHGPL